MKTGTKTTTKRSRKPKPPTGKAEQIIALQTEHPKITRREVAKQVECSPSYVQEVLERYGILKENIDDYKEHRADILAGLQTRIIKSISEQDIQKASLLQRLSGLGIAYDKERLERGKSTSNIAQLHADIAKIRELDNQNNLQESDE